MVAWLLVGHLKNLNFQVVVVHFFRYRVSNWCLDKLIAQRPKLPKFGAEKSEKRILLLCDGKPQLRHGPAAVWLYRAIAIGS